MRVLLALSLAATLATACGTASGVASNPPVVIVTESASPSGAATPTPTSTVRTVLVTLGLNNHTSPSTSAPHAGAAFALGTELTVLAHDPSNGGWYQVQAKGITGWISADPSLTAVGSFQPYSSQTRGFSVLIPINWTFAEETTPNRVVFHPQSGDETIVERGADSLAGLGDVGRPGYTQSRDDQAVVCGVTGDLITYTRASSAPSATPQGSVTALGKFQQIRLKLDATHFLALEHNYASSDQAVNFDNFYNSLTFPFPQCQK